MVEIKSKGRKTRSSGRFGTRYGVKNRKLVADIEEKMHADYACSSCGAIKIKRIATGIWKCTKCETTFTGGSYVPQTPAQATVLRAVAGEKILAAPLTDKAPAAAPGK
ncbi:MAG: 50S ribosomal protein L37ae [Candidatus Methanoperedens sp.]|nr:50S ribosomal protein L37ae [Candidatus Methanoperedens sp.]MCE8424392.1 50S ribosomal protein L37ae [Candidatus Methanoperedens sp.]MCE8427278.1 50S ribosomal protein L37ae [Candidatus Methanoperedens sp.]